MTQRSPNDGKNTNETRPFVSFIIVSWNAREYVTECLESIRENCPVPSEVIVVDNDSKDGTADRVRERFPEFRLVETGANLGFSKGNNIGLALAKGKYLFLVNSDVKVLPGCVDELLSIMESNPDAGLVGPQMLGADGRIRRSTMRFPTLWNSFCRALALDTVFPRSGFFSGHLMGDFDHRQTRDVEILNGWFWVTRREAVEKVGGLDERFFMYGEDMDWSYRLHRAGFRNIFCAEGASIHYGGASSALAPARFYVEQQKANLQYCKKHWGGLATFAYLCTLLLHESIRTVGYATTYLTRKSIRETAAAQVKRSLLCLACLMKLRTV